MPAVLGICCLLFACGNGDDEPEPGQDIVSDFVEAVGDTDSVPDARALTDESADQAPTGESYYSLTLDLEEGPGIICGDDGKVDCLGGKSCCRYQFDRDLTGLDTKFAFGSTHIAPAISLAMTDTMYKPKTAFVILNFGIIIGTADKPASTNSSGLYEFSGFEPEVRVEIFNKKYSSVQEGAQGQFDITDWTAEEGGLWAGTVEGSIVQDTDKETKLQACVKGEFHFILPEPQGGQ